MYKKSSFKIYYDLILEIMKSNDYDSPMTESQNRHLDKIFSKRIGKELEKFKIV